MDLTYQYAEAAVKKTLELLAIDSPTGYTAKAADFVKKEFEALGFAAHLTTKGGVLIDLGGCRESLDGDLLLEAHTDTLGGMVAEIKGNGRLRLTALGGMQAENGEAENVRIYTRSGSVYEGTLQLCNASVHVNKNYSSEKRSFDTTEVVIDEDVRSDSDTRALGIEVGDMVCFDPRSRVTASGYIKSRFLDDKLSVGILWGFARYLADHAVTLPRRTYIHITVYEEVGHGASPLYHMDIEDMLAVDMGCVGDDLSCRETQVSICAKDSAGPYDYDFTNELVQRAEHLKLDYTVDVYPRYSSDASTALRAGMDARFALCGQGVFASHGYERTHVKGMMNTLALVTDVATRKA